MSFSSIFSADTAATSAGEADNDPYNLNRFIKAQNQDDAFDKVIKTFRDGHRKPQPTTWMWFVFPQMNHCQTQSLRVKLSDGPFPYEEISKQTWLQRDVWPRGQALTGLDEARAYLDHPVLGRRIREAADAVLYSAFADKLSLMDNMSMDVSRLHSSMTIFRQASRFPQCIHDKPRNAAENRVFAQVINRYFVSFEFKDYERAWFDYADKALMTYKKGSRHKPTLERLDQVLKAEIERRLEKGLGCVCGRAIDQLDDMDKETKRKMRLSPEAAWAEKRQIEKLRKEKKKQKRAAESGEGASNADDPESDDETQNQNIDPQLVAEEAAPEQTST
ncbi:hypothetical protein Daus18300_008199 [Diaporthe australafricana]|uniref:Uncharacterized protein n=1 Tax=Diaporthe australafricana TaxID=127596 RepID=A0ABR3WJ86_9PEZI